MNTCPHCQKHLTTYAASHIARCPKAAANRDAYRAALDNPANPGQALAADEYDATRPALLYASDVVRQVIGNWPAVAIYFDLTPTPRAQHQRDAAERRRGNGNVLADVGEEIDAAIAAARRAAEMYVSVPPAYRGARLQAACMAAPGMYGCIVREDDVRVHVALW